MEVERFQHKITDPLILEMLKYTLHEALDQIRIIKSILNCSKEISDVAYKTIPERTKQQSNTSSEIIEKENLETNLALIDYVLSTLSNEIEENQTFEKLKQFLKTVSKMKNDEIEIRKAYCDNLQTIDSIEKAYMNEKVKFNEQYFNCLSDIGRIKDNIEDFKLESKIKENYIRKWQQSKIELNKKVNADAENELQNTIRLYVTKIDQETRVHAEMVAALKEFSKDSSDVIKFWEKKYATDLNRKTEDIKTLCISYEHLQMKKKNLESLFNQHNQEIIDYKNYKAKLLELKLENEMKDKAATRIQAWWRGTMVRRCLGPYRKKKDKKQKKKNGSSEKKKNKK